MFRDNRTYEFCAETRNTTYEDCMLNLLTFWEADLILPFSTSYMKIVLRTGGAEARKAVPGWAAHRPLWPEATDSFRRAASAPAGQFDVSELDFTHFGRHERGNLRVDDTERPGVPEHQCRLRTVKNLPRPATGGAAPERGRPSLFLNFA